jgi:energy-coupling factor transporter ATP-binding protein EcfA2
LSISGNGDEKRLSLSQNVHRCIVHCLGQKQQVALAGVMVLQPELIPLDEPTAYLDGL